MKKNRFALWILTLCVIITAIFPTAANAAVTVVDDTCCIYLNDELIEDVECYLDENDEIRVKTVEDLYKVLPDLEAAVAVLPSPDGHVVVDYFDFLEGYTFKQELNSLFIYTPGFSVGDNDNHVDRNDNDDEEDVIDIGSSNTDENDEDEDVIDIRPIIEDIQKENDKKEEPLNVFVNGVRGPWSNSADELLRWAAYNGYFFRQYGNNVFLNNDGNTPIIVKVNGKEVNFPDQQPLIVNPGRTMVPVRAIADCIGNVDITWDGKEQRVTIQSQYNKLVLWIGHSQYWFNGQYYKMDVAPQIMNGRTMVPIRFIAEAFGFTASFDGSDTVNVVSLSSSW